MSILQFPLLFLSDVLLVILCLYLIYSFIIYIFCSFPPLYPLFFFFVIPLSCAFLCPFSPCGGLQTPPLMAGCWFIAQKTSGIWAASSLQKCVVTFTQSPRTCCHSLPEGAGMGKRRWSKKRVSSASLPPQVVDSIAHTRFLCLCEGMCRRRMEYVMEYGSQTVQSWLCAAVYGW